MLKWISSFSFISSSLFYFFLSWVFLRHAFFSLFMYSDFFCPLLYSAYTTAFSLLCFVLWPLKPLTSSKCVASASKGRSTTTGGKKKAALQRNRLHPQSQTWVCMSGYERKTDERLVRVFVVLRKAAFGTEIPGQSYKLKDLFLSVFTQKGFCGFFNLNVNKQDCIISISSHKQPASPKV